MNNATFRRARLHGLAVTLALGATVACGPIRNRTAPQERVVITFTNESLDQANVYAVTGSQAIRIGTVLAGRTEELVVPGNIAFGGQNVNVVARLLAQSRRPSTGPIVLSPGQRIEIRLPMDQRSLVVLPGG